MRAPRKLARTELLYARTELVSLDSAEFLPNLPK